MSGKKFNNIGIVLKPAEIADLPNILTNLIRWLNRRDKKVFLIQKEEERFAGKIPSRTAALINYEKEAFVYSKTDLIISLGGDGTLLGVCRKAHPSVPIRQSLCCAFDGSYV